MKKLILTLTLLLSLGFSLQGVAAQTPDASTPVMGADMDIEGLESAYDRTYMVDFEAMMASPSADLDEMDMSAMMRVVSVQGMTFDSDDNAKKYLDDMKSQIEEAQANGDEMADIEVSELESIDKDGLIITTYMEDLEMGTAAIIFVDGNQVFMIVAIDADLEASSALATDLATYVADAESETDDVNFSEDGTSTGGVFDRMPVAGDDLVSDLPTVTDTVLVEPGE